MKEPAVVLKVPQGIILCPARILPKTAQKMKLPTLIMLTPKGIMKESRGVLIVPKGIILCPARILPKAEQKMKLPKKKIFCL